MTPDQRYRHRKYGYSVRIDHKVVIRTPSKSAAIREAMARVRQPALGAVMHLVLERAADDKVLMTWVKHVHEWRVLPATATSLTVRDKYDVDR